LKQVAATSVKRQTVTACGTFQYLPPLEWTVNTRHVEPENQIAGSGSASNSSHQNFWLQLRFWLLYVSVPGSGSRM